MYQTFLGNSVQDEESITKSGTDINKFWITKSCTQYYQVAHVPHLFVQQTICLSPPPPSKERRGVPALSVFLPACSLLPSTLRHVTWRAGPFPRAALGGEDISVRTKTWSILTTGCVWHDHGWGMVSLVALYPDSKTPSFPDRQKAKWSRENNSRAHSYRPQRDRKRLKCPYRKLWHEATETEPIAH